MKLIFNILTIIFLFVFGQESLIYSNTTKEICFFEKFSKVAKQENNNSERFSKITTNRTCNFEGNLVSY